MLWLVSSGVPSILVSLLLKIYKEIDVGSALLALAFDVVAGRVLNWL